MIIGEYPCCDGPLFLALAPDPLPKFQCEECPHCGCGVWHRHSHYNSQSWTDAAFCEEYNVDNETRRITPKATPQEE